MNEGAFAVVGIGSNVYNWLSYGIVGNSFCSFELAMNRTHTGN